MSNLKLNRWVSLILIAVWLFSSFSPFNSTTLTALAGSADTTANSLKWQDTGKKLISSPNDYYLQTFIDTANPTTLYFGTSRINGYFLSALNWKNGGLVAVGDQTRAFPEQVFSTYSRNNGYVYARTMQWQNDTSAYKEGYKRFSLNDLTGTPIEHIPLYSGQDGSLLTYALDKPEWTKQQPDRNQSHLWFSSDGGLKWLERAQNLPGTFVSLAVSGADAKNLYLLTRQPANSNNTAPGEYDLTLYYSADAGASWDKRYQFKASAITNFEPSIAALTGNTAPVQAVMLNLNPYSGDSPYNQLLSLDGGRTFHNALADCTIECSNALHDHNLYPQLWYGTNGLRRLSYNPTTHQFELSVSLDGQNWAARPALPNEVQTLSSINLVSASFAPSNLLLYGASSDKVSLYQAWYSADEGKSWQKLPDTMNSFLLTPYQPLGVVGIKDGELYTMELPANGATMLEGVTSTNSPQSYFFKETGHNLSGAFKRFWDEQGGLSQFGFPRSEPFLELNQSDGKVYLTQYFERNRFEYHPSNAGTAYEVELGLLGRQLTSGRENEAAFKPIKAFTSRGDSRYFAETGHSLSYGFQTYWEQHGGLAIYGYPITEEFGEMNPDDGQRYTVQYFERGRFEYHPELRGTPYEVLLGLLGNGLLRQKGWL